MAEKLNWPREAFDEAFDEALAKGMVKYDSSAQVMWLPNALNYNPPASPNVVKSWRTEWDLIPECELKYEAEDAVKSFLLSISQKFSDAFDEVRKPSPKPSSKASVKPSRKTSPNQEQDQEQEQEKEERASASEIDAPIPDSDLKVQEIWETYPTANIKPRTGSPRRFEMDAIIEAIIRDGYDLVLAGTRNYRDAVERWPPGEKRYIRAMDKFFSATDSDYAKPPEYWDREHGNGKPRFDDRTKAQRDQDATLDAVAGAKEIFRRMVDRTAGTSGGEQRRSANAGTSSS
jgi:hypothetical protein